ncbi:MAG: hypothetical protein U0324_00435 [Polyangiales bacterium]
MTEPLHDLLREPMFGVEYPDGATARLSLSGVLAALARGELIEFTALRAHQEHAWFAFLVQLGALVVDRTGSSLPTDETAWNSALLELMGGVREAWCLVVDDLAKPAFMQPPPKGLTRKDYGDGMTTPDASPLDVLVTSRRYDVRPERVKRATPEHWAYALVTLQTVQGFSGRGNYGVARMKGGYGNRSCIARAPGVRMGQRFARDVAVWVEQREAMLDRFPYRPSGGHALLWTVPWAGGKEETLEHRSLDPFFVEVCRVVRIFVEGGVLMACYSPTEGPRVRASNEGDTGDIWTWVAGTETPDVFTVGPSGWNYQRLCEILFEAANGAPALQARPEDGKAPLFYGHALVRGQGKTEGLHVRAIPVAPDIVPKLADEKERVRIANLAKGRVDYAAIVRTKVLLPAIGMLLNAGEKRTGAPKRDERPTRWTSAFDARVDRDFFEALWRAVSAADVEAPTLAWKRELRDEALALFEDAARTVPIPSARRVKARAQARNLFEGCARKFLKDLYPQQGEAT